MCAESEKFSVFGRGTLGPRQLGPLLDEILATAWSVRYVKWVIWGVEFDGDFHLHILFNVKRKSDKNAKC